MYMLTSINLNDHHYYLLQCCISGTKCKYSSYKVYFISISFHLVNANQIVFIGTEKSGLFCYLEL